MSDSLRAYSAIKAKVCQVLSGEEPARQANLSLMITGIVRSRSVQQRKVAGEVPFAAQATSLMQRQRRFLMNEHVDAGAYYHPFIAPFVQARSRMALPLIIDSSAAGRYCQMLMVSIGYRRRALPLTWKVRRGQKGNFKAGDHQEVLDRAAEFLPAEALVVLVGDGEFGYPARAEDARQRGWEFVLRASEDDVIWIEGEPFSLREFSVGPGESLWLEDALWTHQRWGPVNVLVTWNEREKAPMYLVSSFPLPEETSYWYRRRPWIETLFRDDKSMGFHLHLSRLRHPERMARLLLAVALAYLWMMYLGTLAVLGGLQRLVDRSDRRDCSFFTIGCEWLRRLLKLDKHIPVGFCPYPYLCSPTGV
ncbi:MAG: transposase [Anaerolineae bacterium]